MSGIQTNFRAEDMIGAAKPVVEAVKPAPVKPAKVAKAAPIVEETVELVEETVELVEE